MCLIIFKHIGKTLVKRYFIVVELEINRKANKKLKKCNFCVVLIMKFEFLCFIVVELRFISAKTYF